MNRIRLLSSLRGRLMVLVLLAVIPVLLVIFYDATEMRKREVAQAQADALTLSQLAARQHEEVIETTRRVLLSLAQLPEVRGDDPQACSNRLKELVAEYEGYNAFSVVDRDGNVTCSSLPANRPINVASRTWFQRTIDTLDFAVGDYQIGLVGGTPVLPFGYPIFDAGRQIRAMVVATLNVDRLNQIASEVQLAEGTTLTIVDRQGNIIIRQPDAEAWVGQQLPDQPLIMAILESQEGRTEVNDLDGVNRLFAFTALHSSVNTGLYLAIGIPKQVAFARADQIWLRNLRTLGLLCLLVLAAAWFGSEFFVLRSVNQLIAATHRLRRDLSARTNLSYEGEIGQLAKAFDDLATGLEQREADRNEARANLIALNTGLEQRVIQRTALIRESEQRLAEAQRIAHVGSWQWDIPNDNLVWSDELYRIHGLDPKERNASYENFVNQLHPDDRARAGRIVEQALQNHQPFGYEHRIIRPDGTIRVLHARGTVVVNEQGQPIQMIGTGHDITELKEAEAEIRRLNADLEQRVTERTAQLAAANKELAHEIEERKRAQADLADQSNFLRQIIDINPNMIFAKDRAGHFTLVNQAVAEMYGAPVEGLIGKTDADFNQNAAEVEHFRQDDLAVIDSRREKFVAEEQITDAAGRIHWLQTVKRPLTSQDGQVNQLLGVATDITERKRIEAELREQHEIIETVNQAGQMLAAELDLQKLIQTITNATTELSGAQVGAFFYNLIDDQGESYTLYTISGVEQAAFAKFPLPRNTELFGPTFHGERIVRIDNVREDPRYGQNAPYYGMPAGHLPVTSYLAVPVISRTGETLGGLFFGHEEAGVFTERTEQLIAGLVSQAAVAIDNAQLYQEAQQLNATLEQRVLERTAELQASEQTFRELVNILPIAVYVCEPSGLIESYNRRAVELWGREPKLHDSADRYCGSHQLYTLDGVPLPHPDCFMAQVLHTGIAISNQEIIVERPDGVRRMGIVNIIPRRDDRGNLTGAINCLLDVTDLKEIEEELRKSQAMFQGLFESAPDAIILVNDQGEIVRLNRQAEELFGYDRTALETKPIEELLPSRFHKNHLTHRASYHNNPRPRQMGFGLELYGQHRDGTEIPVDVTLSPLKGEGETLTISIIRDITEKKRLEDELTDVQRRLFESSERERLRIAQELHDGPIQELYGVYYRMGDLESAMVNEASIAKLTSAAVLVQQVTQNLRSLCMELRPPTLAAFGLEKAIRSHTEYFQTAHPGLIMDLDLMPDGQELPERTRLALFRIYQEGLNNIARHAEADHIWVRLNLDDNNVTLEIRDNGQGFTVPRHWVHMARDGHLGVIGMSERAQSIRGYLDIKSAPGEGAFLKVVVPRHNGHESED